MNKLLRKIAPATVCPEKLVRLDQPNSPSEVVLYDVYGITNSFRLGKTDKGDFIQFKGQFEAQTPQGEIFASGSLFLQQPFEDMLFSQLESVKSQDPNGVVQFACRISLVPPTKGKVSATGYEYQCIPLLQSHDSPLDSIRSLVANAREALALPANAGSAQAPKAKTATK